MARYVSLQKKTGVGNATGQIHVISVRLEMIILNDVIWWNENVV